MKFQQIEPQPARGKLVESMWTDDNWIAEEKYDGFRMVAQFGDHVRLTSRRLSVKTREFQIRSEQLPHISGVDTPAFDALDAVPPPSKLRGTVLDGEIVLGPVAFDNFRQRDPTGAASKEVGSIVNSNPEVAIAKQIERGWLRYVVFDCLFYKGKAVGSEDLRTRGMMAADAVKAWGNAYVSLAATKGGPFKWEFLKTILAAGGEGVILKHLDHRYGDKNGWVKVKAEWNADVVIIGFKDAKEMSTKKGDDAPTMTKYAKLGLIGAIEIAQYAPKGGLKVPGFKLRDGQAAYPDMIDCGTVSGMADQLRRDMTARPEKYLNKVIEIRHNGREPTGRFRHPRFKQFRSDKSPKDCIYREEEI